MKFTARIISFGLFLLIISQTALSFVSAQETSPLPTVKTTPYPSISITQVVSSSSIALPVGSVLAATAPPPGSLQLTGIAGEAKWVIDAEVTQVGRNAERARQLIYWVVTNPDESYRSMEWKANIINETWVITRNIAYLLVVFVIIGLALHLIISRTMLGPTFSGISLGFDKVTLMSIVIRVVAILAFVTFSYLIVRGLIEGAYMLSNFFIERLGGQDLFNIVFTGSNDEVNYNFVGYKNADPLEQDMVFTSLLLVKFTSFTYNFMSIILILRHVILLFLLILSPFLALLVPFIFIRNTGWIWIGEFFRWLLYGPLFALFIAALARIWKAGIPYQFNFDRVYSNDPMVYHTGINILYGGPAQILSPTNTSNYVDTYAEYIIALVMLWTAILLPWLLLRIFRDYCCDILEKNQGVLMQILDKIRNITPPKPPPAPKKPGPTRTFGKEMQVPESRSISSREVLTREKIIEKINSREINQIETRDITRAYDLRISNLKDIARYDTNKSEQSQIKETLSNIQNPLRISNPSERKQYEDLRAEFTQRANHGDKLARQIIEAATPKASQIQQTVSVKASHNELKKAINEPGKPVSIEKARVPSTRIVSPRAVQSISEKTNVEENAVREVLKDLVTDKTLTDEQKEERVKKLSKRVRVTEDQVKKIINTAEKEAEETTQSETQKASPDTIREVAEKTQVSQDEVERVLDEVVNTTNKDQQKQIGEISEKTGLSESKIKRVLDATPSDQMPKAPAPTPAPTVPIEEYEEIRTMWMNHYRNSEIPLSESIKTRDDWINEDVKQLTNTLDLLISRSVKDRQQGMQNVGDLLPFLLLGGFTDIQTLTYIKAKLEAAKFIMDESKRVEDAKKEGARQAEELENIPTIEPKEKQKQAELHKALEMPIPEEESRLPGFHEEVKSPKLPDLPYKPKITIIDPSSLKKVDNDEKI